MAVDPAVARALMKAAKREDVARADARRSRDEERRGSRAMSAQKYVEVFDRASGDRERYYR